MAPKTGWITAAMKQGKGPKNWMNNCCSERMKWPQKLDG